MFMRLRHCATRLVVVDEATSSLDPVAERDIITALRKRRTGKTIVLVTHRFHHLAHEADRILYVVLVLVLVVPDPHPHALTRVRDRCIKDGVVVESGTHDELVGVGGDYAALYDAQVGRSG